MPCQESPGQSLVAPLPHLPTTTSSNPPHSEETVQWALELSTKVREVSTVKLGKGSYKAYITYLVPHEVCVSPLARVPGPHLLAADGGLATLHLVVVT